MSKRFDYVKYDERSVRISEEFKRMYSSIAEVFEGIPTGDKETARAKALALTKLEESYMWIGKMIRNAQVHENGNSEHLPERNDS